LLAFSATGNCAFFQAVKPPSKWHTLGTPILWRVCVANAERQAEAQYNTNRLPSPKIGF